MQPVRFQIAHAHNLADFVSRSPGSAPRYGQRKLKRVVTSQQAVRLAVIAVAGARSAAMRVPPAHWRLQKSLSWASLASRSVLLRGEMAAAANAAATERTRMRPLIRREIGAD
jgi:hypothetical protein